MKIDRQQSWKAAFFWSVSAVLLLSTWFFLNQVFLSGLFSMPSIGILIGLIATCATLTLALERSLCYLHLQEKWRYRLAFLLSLSLIGVKFFVSWPVFSFLSSLPGDSAQHLWTLPAGLVAGAGSFFGGLLATALNARLWEDNLPPAARIQAEVYQQHAAVIGEPGPPPPAKRLFDITLACLGLLLSFPVWALSALLVWFEDPGPVLFVKNSVGKGGRNFRQYKFRTMVHGAEAETGPVLSQKGDHRVLFYGRFLRKTALDELPQLLNILKGEMSFVGPRPQRTVLVNDYLRTMPEYAQRHRVLPGLAGLAQVAGDYYLTPRQKLRFDRLYIRYTGLGFDLKLLLLAFMITFWFRWRKDWNGRLPRKLLRVGSHSRNVKREELRFKL